MWLHESIVAKRKQGPPSKDTTCDSTVQLYDVSHVVVSACAVDQQECLLARLPINRQTMRLLQKLIWSFVGSSVGSLLDPAISVVGWGLLSLQSLRNVHPEDTSNSHVRCCMPMNCQQCLYWLDACTLSPSSNTNPTENFRIDGIPLKSRRTRHNPP